MFVSYSRHDEDVVKPLAALLTGVTAKPLFLDIESIKPGDVWPSEIEDAVKTSEVFVLCWCCQSEQSKFVKREIRLAVKVKDRRLIPVLFCSMPLPKALADRQWVDLRGRISHTCDREQHPGGIIQQLPVVQQLPVADQWSMVRNGGKDDAQESISPTGESISAWWSAAGVVVAITLVLVVGFRLDPKLAPYLTPSSISLLLVPLAFLLTINLIGFSSVLLYRRWRARREQEADEVAQTARKYFEELGS